MNNYKFLMFYSSLIQIRYQFSCSREWKIFGQDDITQISRCILHYKALFIISTGCNLVFGQIALPFIKFIVMFLFTTSFFAIVRLYDRMNLLSFILFSVITWTTLLLLIPTTFIMSSLYKTSKNFIRNFIPSIRRMNATNQQKEVLLRQLGSCSVIRCKVGGLYYMEAKAKLTVIHKLVNGLKYLLVHVKQ